MISRDLARDPSPTRERDAVLTCGAACVHLQVYIAEQEGLPEGSKPVSFVFHGGSGSDINDIKQAGPCRRAPASAPLPIAPSS